MLPHYSRSTADHDASHSVGKTIGKQAGDVIVHNLHFTALELSNLMQADLVLLRVLEEYLWKEKDGGCAKGRKTMW